MGKLDFSFSLVNLTLSKTFCLRSLGIVQMVDYPICSLIRHYDAYLRRMLSKAPSSHREQTETLKCLYVGKFLLM